MGSGQERRSSNFLIKRRVPPTPPTPVGRLFLSFPAAGVLSESPVLRYSTTFTSHLFVLESYTHRFLPGSVLRENVTQDFSMNKAEMNNKGFGEEKKCNGNTLIFRLTKIYKNANFLFSFALWSFCQREGKKVYK